MKKVLLAAPRGYCAGVERAIAIVEHAINEYGPPVYVRHEIVHNAHVVDSFRRQGVIFMNDVNEIPEGAITVFSAHGVSEAVERKAEARNLRVIDATCPLVAKVHTEAIRYRDESLEVILVGHRGHPEVEGTMGRIPDGVHLVETKKDVEEIEVSDPERLAYVTQTTLSVDDVRGVIDTLVRRFPSIRGLDTKDICYATKNRQQAVRKLAEHVDLIIVVGGKMSSNSARLRDLGERRGVPSYRIENASELAPSWIENAKSVGVTSGASTPEGLVTEVVERIRKISDGTTHVESLEGPSEKTKFRFPETWPSRKQRRTDSAHGLGNGSARR